MNSDPSNGLTSVPATRPAKFSGDRYAAMDAIRAFLVANGLDPTPDHYGLAHRYLVVRDTQVVDAVDQALKANGRLSPDSAARILTESRTDLPVALVEELINASRQNLDRLAEILGQSREEARSYGDHLETNAEAFAKTPPSQRLVNQFIDLTRSLIGRTRDAETRMREMDDHIAELRTNLDDATRSADSDPLTGLANRRAFERRLQRAIRAAKTDQSPVTLAYCDIDHFKDINDTHGHEVGDRVLKFVGQLLLREADDDTHVARFGGEEFVMLFEHVPFERAAEVVNQLRLELGARRLHVRESGEQIGAVTFSAGLAPWEEEQNGEALLRSADRALYCAKELGRDRVVSSRDAELLMKAKGKR